jgi:hypothetical protein
MWPRVKHWIEAAMRRCDLNSYQPVEDAVLNGLAQLWVAHDEIPRAAAVTSMDKTDARKICVMIACGGNDRDDWISLLNEIEDYARIEGCHAMRIYGRNGWKRVLPDYRQKRVILEKAI